MFLHEHPAFSKENCLRCRHAQPWARRARIPGRLFAPQKCLENVPNLQTIVYSNGWPPDPRAFDGADAIVLSMDGSEAMSFTHDEHLQQLAPLMKKGVGLACIHWAVEPTPDKGEKEMLAWMGGAFRTELVGQPHLGR